MSGSNTPRSEKDVVLVEKGEKGGVDIEVVESQQPPQRSTRERFARFTNSIFTKKTFSDTGSVLWKFARFAGPGAVISVAYVDPDNLQSNVTAGAEFRFKLLFMILFSNVVAVFLQVGALDLRYLQREAERLIAMQALSTKLGCVTGMDLAQMNRAFLPRWLNIGLWLMAEASIICTDISQVCPLPHYIPILNPT
jgi:metal iron transporter